jgi:hypothetical protein
MAAGRWIRSISPSASVVATSGTSVRPRQPRQLDRTVASDEVASSGASAGTGFSRGPSQPSTWRNQPSSWFQLAQIGDATTKRQHNQLVLGIEPEAVVRPQS